MLSEFFYGSAGKQVVHGYVEYRGESAEYFDSIERVSADFKEVVVNGNVVSAEDVLPYSQKLFFFSVGGLIIPFFKYL